MNQAVKAPPSNIRIFNKKARKSKKAPRPMSEEVANEQQPLLECLALCMKRQGVNAKQQTLLYAQPVDGEILKPADIAEIAIRNGFEAAMRKLSLKKMNQALFPMVLEFKDGGACVLLERKDEGYKILLPESGNVSIDMDHATLSKRYSGRCVIARPGFDANQLLEEKVASPRTWFWGVIWRFKSYYAQAVVAAFLINILALATTFYTMTVYDRVIPNEGYATLMALTIGVGIAMFFELIVKNMRAWMLDLSAKKAGVLLGGTLYRQVLGIRLENHSTSPGIMANQIREYESLRDFVASATLALLSDLPFILLFLGLIYAMSGPLVLVPMAIIPIILTVAIVTQWPLSRIVRENMSVSNQNQGLLVESINGVETVKALRAEGALQKKWEVLSSILSRGSMKTKLVNAFSLNFIQTLQTVSLVLIVAWGAHLVGAGEITQGVLIGTVILNGRLLGIVTQGAGLILRWLQVKHTLKMLNDIMDRPIDRERGKNYLVPEQLEGRFKFENIGFNYPDQETQILTGVNLKVNPGEKIAIIGKVGSGKSTLLKILANLYQPTSGKLLVDDVDMQQLHPGWIRSKMAYAAQESQIFSGTLRENLLLANPYADDQAITAAMRESGLHAIVARHPKGLDMEIGGTQGVGFSGGEKQIISWTRTLLANPDIVLLDEPTSAMDQQSENNFIQSCKEFTQSKSLIVVTHKMALLNMVDRVIIVDSGRIAVDGAKDEIMKKMNEMGQ